MLAVLFLVIHDDEEAHLLPHVVFDVIVVCFLSRCCQGMVFVDRMSCDGRHGMAIVSFTTTLNKCSLEVSCSPEAHLTAFIFLTSHCP